MARSFLRARPWSFSFSFVSWVSDSAGFKAGNQIFSEWISTWGQCGCLRGCQGLGSWKPTEKSTLGRFLSSYICPKDSSWCICFISNEDAPLCQRKDCEHHELFPELRAVQRPSCPFMSLLQQGFSALALLEWKAALAMAVFSSALYQHRAISCICQWCGNDTADTSTRKGPKVMLCCSSAPML